MNRIRTIAPLVILFVLVIAGASYAQQVTKVAIINSQKAFETSLEGKKALGQLQDLDSRIKTNLQKMDDAIRLLDNRLNTGRLTMTTEALMALQADIDKKTTERKRYEEDQARDAQALSTNLIQKIRTEMVAVIEILAKERGLELVLDGPLEDELGTQAAELAQLLGTTDALEQEVFDARLDGGAGGYPSFHGRSGPSLSAVLGVVLALPTAERDPAEQQHPGHVWATADIDRRPSGLGRLVGSHTGGCRLAVVVPGQDLRNCANAHFVDESGKVLIARIEPMAARRGLPLQVIKAERLADLDRGELCQANASTS